jgi:hypothetical protein
MVFARGSKSNWNREDDLQPATGITCSFSNNQDTGRAVRQLGFSITDCDADLCALPLAASQAQLYLNQNQVANITVLSTNLVAIQATTNL